MHTGLENHAHSTHYTDHPDPRIPHVLRGCTISRVPAERRGSFHRGMNRQGHQVEDVMSRPLQPINAFDYAIAAELFATKGDASMPPSHTRRARRQPAGYGRFARAAYAIRFAMEELPAELFSESCLRIHEKMFDADGIRQLYESEGYPLVRGPRSVDHRASNVLPWKNSPQ